MAICNYALCATERQTVCRVAEPAEIACYTRRGFFSGVSRRFLQRDVSRSTNPGGIVKLLLTSAGVKNASIRKSLVGLLRKPIADSNALCIPTAMYGHPAVGPGAGAWRFISGQERDCPMCELGWKSVGVLELTALPSIDEERWMPKVRETDVLLVSGGDAVYLAHWMRQSGFTDLIPSLGETVYVGMSAGSMVLTPRIGNDFVGWKPRTGGDDRTLGVVDFSIFPHLDHPMLPENTMADAERWAAGIPGPSYAIDDDTAIKVSDGAVEVVSEGRWRRFPS
jgi:dipeptidase E